MLSWRMYQLPLGKHLLLTSSSKQKGAHSLLNPQPFQLHRAETPTRSQGVVAVREASWMVVGTPNVFQCLRATFAEFFSKKNMDEAATSENKRSLGWSTTTSKGTIDKGMTLMNFTSLCQLFV